MDASQTARQPKSQRTGAYTDLKTALGVWFCLRQHSLAAHPCAPNSSRQPPPPNAVAPRAVR